VLKGYHNKSPGDAPSAEGLGGLQGALGEFRETSSHERGGGPDVVIGFLARQVFTGPKRPNTPGRESAVMWEVCSEEREGKGVRGIGKKGASFVCVGGEGDRKERAGKKGDTKRARAKNQDETG